MAGITQASGSSLKAKTADGQSILHYAASSGNYTLVRRTARREPWLLRQRDKHGALALDVALQTFGAEHLVWQFLAHCEQYPGPSFAYSLPVHSFHTRRDRVASLRPCRLHHWRGHTKSLATRARPSPDLAVWLE